jgi:REP element-mobilizing transposase RayT
MARPLRIQYEGGLYHVTLRGNERKAIVRDDDDRNRFVGALGASVLRHGVILHLYCLMDNHAHLVVETPHANLSPFMQNFQTRYIVWFNRRHQRSGHLMQGRYGARLVEADRYLLQLSRYLHLNPVRTRTAEKLTLAEQRQLLRRYRWSSYLSYIGEAGRPEFLTERPILEQVGGRGVEWVHVRLQGEDAQRSGGGVDVPGGIQHAQLLDLAPLICQDVAARQGEGAKPGGVAQRQG